METKGDDDDDDDRPVKIEQSASGRVEDRVLQKRVTETCMNVFICENFQFINTPAAKCTSF